MPYPKVTAAEKYAEIGGRENAPPCEHGLMYWHTSTRLISGGRWRCQHERVAAATRRLRRRRAEVGICVRCSAAATTGVRCAPHAEMHSLEMRQTNRRKVRPQKLELIRQLEQELEALR